MAARLPRRLCRVAFLFVITTVTLLVYLFGRSATHVVIRGITPTKLPYYINLEAVHPIEELHRSWLAKFNEKVQSQSTSLADAVAEYKRRYGREPPKGFHRWYDLAVENGYALIDEFDALESTLQPYLSTDSSMLRTHLSEIQTDDNMMHIEVLNGLVTRTSRAPGHSEWIDNRGDWIERLIKKHADAGLLDNFNLTANLFDEPMVNSPYDLEHDAQPSSGGSSSFQSHFLDFKGRGVWLEPSLLCPQGPLSATKEYRDLDPVNATILSGAPSGQDYCREPSLLQQHSIFISPMTLWVTHKLVPIFSQARPQNFQDLLFPGPFYLEEMKTERLDAQPTWAELRSKLYWAGGSTGGWNTADNWRQMHRARLTLLTKPWSKTPMRLLDATENGLWAWTNSTWSLASDLFDLTVSTIRNCGLWTCLIMLNEFHHPWKVSNHANLAYKYVLDIDGNSFSGRYYRLLRTDSAVIKSTIFREWHDDLLIPWVHYFPLSMSGAELGEMMRFLVHHPRGDKLGQMIANESKVWGRKVLNEQHMEVYFLRVLLEYQQIMRRNLP